MSLSRKVQTRAAVIDIGSNSIHLLVADRSFSQQGYRLRQISSPATLLGLGRRVAERGMIDEHAAAELARVVSRQVKQAVRAGASELSIVATAAVRQAANGPDCMATLAASIGQSIHILSEAREAELGFIGLVLELDPVTECLVIDGGGASTEVTLARGRRRGDWVSLPIGGSSLSLEYGDPPTAAQLERVRERVDTLLGGLPVGQPVAAVATGGSARKLPVIVGGRSGDPIDQPLIDRALQVLQAVPAALLAKGTGLPLRRVQSLTGGATILSRLLHHYGVARCQNSPHGLREGILLAVADEPESWWVDVAAVQEHRHRFELTLTGSKP